MTTLKRDFRTSLYLTSGGLKHSGLFGPSCFAAYMPRIHVRGPLNIAMGIVRDRLLNSLSRELLRPATHHYRMDPKV